MPMRLILCDQLLILSGAKTLSQVFGLGAIEVKVNRQFSALA